MKIIGLTLALIFKVNIVNYVLYGISRLNVSRLQNWSSSMQLLLIAVVFVTLFNTKCNKP